VIANKTLLYRKFARVIGVFAQNQNMPIRDALDIFYSSRLYWEMSNGISDMHCRSDEYLAEELRRETDSEQK
jgi:hypothetical protein